MSLRLNVVDARQGAVWVSQSFSLFLKRPLAFSAQFALCLFAGLALLALPYIGAVLLLAAWPLVSLGFMIASRSVLGGGNVHPGQLVEPLRVEPGDTESAARRRKLLHLLALFALSNAAVMLVSDWIDGGAFERLQVLVASSRDVEGQKQIDALLDDGGLQRGLLLRLFGTALLALPFWHAPALVWWHGQSVGQALFSSTLACWRNRGAFLVYGLAWLLTVGLFSLVAGSIFALLGAPQLVTLAAVPAGLMFSTVFYVSLLPTFEACFGDDIADTLVT